MNNQSDKPILVWQGMIKWVNEEYPARVVRCQEREGSLRVEVAWLKNALDEPIYEHAGGSKELILSEALLDLTKKDPVEVRTELPIQSSDPKPILVWQGEVPLEACGVSQETRVGRVILRDGFFVVESCYGKDIMGNDLWVSASGSFAEAAIRCALRSKTHP